MKNLKLKLKTLIMVFVFVFVVEEISAQTTVTITPATKYQTIEGWGVSLAWWANIAGGWADISNITWKAAVDLNMNVFRFNISGGENPNCAWGKHFRTDGGELPGYRVQQADQQGWGIVDLTKDVRQIAIMDKLATYRTDIITEVCSYSPPWWMTKSKCTSGNTDGSENLDPNYADDFADYLASVTAALRNRNSAWNIKYIGPFNEPASTWWKPSATGGQEGCYFSPTLQATVLRHLLQSQDTYKISDIHRTAPDGNTVVESQLNMSYLLNHHNSEYSGIAKINTHTYYGTRQEKASLCTDAKNNGKKLWMSESGPLNWSPSDGKSWWQRHYMMTYRQVEDIRNLQCTAWCDWQFMSTDEGWGLVQIKNYDPANPYQTPVYSETRGYYTRKQINSFIKSGYTIIQSNDSNSLTALKPDNKEVVVVIVNQTSAAKPYTIDLTKFKTVSSFKTYRTSGDYTSTENCTEKTTASKTEKGIISANKISYIAPAWSVTTFVVQIQK